MKQVTSNYTKEDIITNLQKWFIDTLNIKVDNDEKYIDNEILNSFEIINLVIHIESEYNIVFTSEDFLDLRFITLNGLSNIIREKTLHK